MLIGTIFVTFLLYFLAQIIESSTLVTVVVFNILSIVLTFPLKGPLCAKLLWLGIGNSIGIVWNLVRLALITAATGIRTEPLSLVNFILGPATDFMWLVPVWSLGLSVLSSFDAQRRR